VSTKRPDRRDRIGKSPITKNPIRRDRITKDRIGAGSRVIGRKVAPGDTVKRRTLLPDPIRDGRKINLPKRIGTPITSSTHGKRGRSGGRYRGRNISYSTRRLGIATNIVDGWERRHFKSGGRHRFVSRNRWSFQLRFGLGFAFGWNYCHRGFWDFAWGSCYAPYWYDCWSFGKGYSYYWWLPRSRYPLWRRYWVSQCLSRSWLFGYYPYDFCADGGSTYGFNDWCNVYAPSGDINIYFDGRSDEPEADDFEDGSADAKEPSRAERYKAASVDDLARHYLELGDVYFRNKQWDRAAGAYEKAIDLVPEDGSLRLVLADALFALAKYGRAGVELRKAFYLDPALLESAVDKRDFYEEKELFDKQLASLVDFVKEHPFDGQARLVLAVNYRFSNEPEKAKKELETLGEQMPGDATVKSILESLEKKKD